MNINTKTLVTGSLKQDPIQLNGELQVNVRIQPTDKFCFGRQSVVFNIGQNSLSFVYNTTGNSDHFIKYVTGTDVDYINLEGKYGTPFNFGYYTDPKKVYKLQCIYGKGVKQLYVDDVLLFTKNITDLNPVTGLMQCSLSANADYDWLNCYIIRFNVFNKIKKVLLTTVNEPVLVTKPTDYCFDSALTQLNTFKTPVFSTQTPRMFSVFNMGYVSGNNKQLAKQIQLVLSQKFNWAIRVAEHLPDVDDYLKQPNSIVNGMIELAKEHPEIPCDISSAWAHLTPKAGYRPYDLSTLTSNTNSSVLEGDKQIVKYEITELKKVLDPIIPTRMVENGEVLNWNLGDKFAVFTNKMLEGIKEVYPNIDITQYDIYDASFWTSYQPSLESQLTISTTGMGTVQQYCENPQVERMWEGNKRGLGFYFRSKFKEIALGHPLNTPFVSAGWNPDPTKNLTPAQYLGFLKLLQVGGVKYFHPSYFTLGGTGIQNPATYIFQAVMPSYAQASVSSHWDIIENGTLLPGDQIVNWYNNGNVQPEYNFWSGTKEIFTVVRKLGNEFLIATQLLPLNNDEAQPESRNCSILLEGNVIKLTSRVQGSVYHYNANTATLTQLDGDHLSTHPFYW